MTKITERIIQQAGMPDLLERLAVLPASDLNSLLLEIHKQTTDKITPAGLLKNYQSNRFTSPSSCNPADLYHLAEQITSLADSQGIPPVLLSPVAPLGSCSAFGCVDQNNVLSSVRGCETMADASNMLAIILADQISQEGFGSSTSLHRCALHQLTRAQQFKGAKAFSHFHIFCIVSSGKSVSSYGCETELLQKQLVFYNTFFSRFTDASLSMVIRKRGGYKDSDGFLNRMAECVSAVLPHVPLSITEDGVDNHYYQGINFKMYLHTQDQVFEIGDGGFTDWIGQMTGNHKLRCLISGIGIDRLLL